MAIDLMKGNHVDMGQELGMGSVACHRWDVASL